MGWPRPGPLMADPDTAATRVLILTTFDLDEYVFGAIRAGASGFLPKDTTPEELLTAIRVVAAGDSLLAPKATRRLIEEFVRQSPVPEPARPPGLDQLTDREIEVLRVVARGHSNTEIADELVISYATAKSHVSSLLAKLQVRDRAQLVMLAYEYGVVTPTRDRGTPARAGWGVWSGVHGVELVGEVLFDDRALDLQAGGEFAAGLGEVAGEDGELLDRLPAVQGGVQLVDGAWMAARTGTVCDRVTCSPVIWWAVANAARASGSRLTRAVT